MFFCLLIPLLQLLYGSFTDNLGTNPVETLTHETGKWGLICLILSLCATPIKNITGWKYVMRMRRMLGLFCFFYVLLHFLIYWLFDQSLSFKYVWEDIKDRPYITLGVSGFILLIPLAITSTQRMQRRLGKRWISLHKLTYLVAILALAHYVWLIRADYAEVIWYSVVIIILLVYRIPFVNRFLSLGRG